MDDNRLSGPSAGFERFGQLEDRIFLAVEEIKAIRRETEDLRGENGRLNDLVNEHVREIEALRSDNDNFAAQEAGKHEQLRGENDSLRSELETMRHSETEMFEALAQFEKEREELRERVEKTLTLLASLDASSNQQPG